MSALTQLATRAKLSADAVLFRARAMLQLRGLADEVHQKIEMMGHYAFSARPKAGGDVMLLQVGANRDHKVALGVDDPALRIPDLQPGEFGYQDDQGQMVVFRRDKIQIVGAKAIEIVSTGPMNITVTGEVNLTASGNVNIAGDAVNLN